MQTCGIGSTLFRKVALRVFFGCRTVAGGNGCSTTDNAYRAICAIQCTLYNINGCIRGSVCSKYEVDLLKQVEQTEADREQMQAVRAVFQNNMMQELHW